MSYAFAVIAKNRQALPLIGLNILFDSRSDNTLKTWVLKNMPRQMIEPEISRGELVVLDSEQWDSSNKMPRITALIAKRKDKAMGPAASFIMDEIANCQTK